VKIALRHELAFDFWGAPTRLLVEVPSDAEHLASYFRSFTAAPTSPAAEIALATAPAGMGFVASALDPDVQKLVLTRRSGGEWQLYDSFSMRSHRRSPLPPFHAPELRDSLGVLHAAALVAADGDAVLLCGRSLSGKSAVSLSLLERGWALLSDDLAVVRLADLCALRFDRPVGIRANTLRMLPWLSDRLAGCHDRLFRADVWTGTTVMAHVDDLYPGQGARSEAPVRTIYLLEPRAGDTRFAVERVPVECVAEALRPFEALETTASHSADWSRTAVHRVAFDVEHDLRDLTDLLAAEDAAA